MQAIHRSARLAPKKANLVASMIRGMPVPDAVELLRRTNKKGARLLEGLLQSAMANAQHTFKQDPQTMIIKTVVVNQGTAYHRGIPMARGRVRPIRKFTSHISLTLGYPVDQQPEKKDKVQKTQTIEKNQKKEAKNATNAKNATKKAVSTKAEKTSSQSSPSSQSSKSST